MILKRNDVSGMGFRKLESDEWGIKSGATSTRTCPYCHQKYKHASSEIDWKSDFDKKVFCSYNCRAKYYKANADRRAEVKSKYEITYWVMEEKISVQKSKQREKSKARYQAKKIANMQSKNAKTGDFKPLN